MKFSKGMLKGSIKKLVIIATAFVLPTVAYAASSTPTRPAPPSPTYAPPLAPTTTGLLPVTPPISPFSPLVPTSSKATTVPFPAPSTADDVTLFPPGPFITMPRRGGTGPFGAWNLERHKLDRLTTQINYMRHQIYIFNQQLEIVNKQYKGQSGRRTQGDLFNNPGHQRERINPNEFLDIMKYITNNDAMNNDASDELKRSVDRIWNDYKLDEFRDLGTKPITPEYTEEVRDVDRSFKQAGAASIAAMAVAEQGYRRARYNLSRVPDYLDEINDTEDIKSSIDLNNRLLLDLIQSSNQRMQLMSALTSSISTFTTYGASARLSQQKNLFD